MDDDGRGEGGRTRLARGTKPHARTAGGEVTSEGAHAGSNAGAPAQTAEAPVEVERPSAQSICEAVEQLIEAKEADEAIAEWMRAGG